MNDSRVQLAAIVRAEYDRGVDGPIFVMNTVDALLATGWRPPAVVIKTVEELDALPAGALVVEETPDLDSTSHPLVWLRFDAADETGVDGLMWQEPGGENFWRTSDITLPVRVLLLPKEK